MPNPNLSIITGAIERSVPVLTVNTRLSRYLKNEYDRLMVQSGIKLWQTPVIMPFSAWAERFFNDSYGTPVITPERSRALWETIISSSRVMGKIMGEAPPESLAPLAAGAYRLLNDYRVGLPAGADEIYLTEEARAFKAWAADYERETKRLGFIDGGRVLAELERLVSSGRAEVPKELMLAGFDELNPAEKSFIKALEAKGASISFWPPLPDSGPPHISIAACKDMLDEAEQAARWARSLAGGQSTIGIIAPDLGAYRDLIDREFRAELDPASTTALAGGDPVYNISLGKTLNMEPLVESALRILSAGEGAVKSEDLGQILLDRYFWTGEEYFLAARADAGLRKENLITASLPEMVKRLERYGDLSRTFRDWIEALKEGRKKEAPSYWAGHFDLVLKKTGWLKRVKLTSREYQAHEAWNSALSGLAGLDDMTGRLTRAQALSKLRSIISGTIHQPKTPDTNIQVMGLLESAGQYFDHLLLLGCHEFALPAQPSPNPFIPLHLQKKAGMPDSSHEREAAFADAALRRILTSSGSVRASYPVRSDEKDLLCSPLVLKYPHTFDEGRYGTSSRFIDTLHESRSLEDMPPEPPMPVTEEEKKSVYGGTSIIKDQSLCPFKAFATYRLNAVELPATELGLSNSDRGSILHKAMKLFWEEVRGSERLNELMANGGLSGFVKGLTERVLADAGPLSPISRRFMEIERERLESLMLDWARVEAGRGPFRVKATEALVNIDIGGLSIKGRLDRVDEVEGLGEAVLDYKSGAASREDWIGERPRDPQLVIYAVAGGYGAVSFARLRPGETRFIGVSNNDAFLPGIKAFEHDTKLRDKCGHGITGWEGLMAFWKETIEGLAKEFLAGVARVDPNIEKPGESPCKHCEMGPLCRIFEAGFFSGDDGNDGQ